MNRAWYGIGAALLAAAGGAAAYVSSCSPETCTLEARASVQVEFVDHNGRAMPGKSVWYVAHASDDQESLEHPVRAECVDENCTTWVAGREVPGGFEISAAACGDVQTQSVTVDMEADDCHVATQKLQIPFECLSERPGGPETTLANGGPTPPATACSPEPYASIKVSVVDDETGMMRPATATGFTRVPFEEREVEVEPAPTSAKGSSRPMTGLGSCASDLCDTWEIGEDMDGRFEVWVEACGQRETFDVEVEMGACHAETESLIARIDCSAPPRPGPEAALSGTDDRPPSPEPACSDEKYPSVELTVVDAKTGMVRSADAAKYKRVPFEEQQLDEGEAPAPTAPVAARPEVADGTCKSELCDVWLLGEELPGRFEVYAEACGKTSETVKVEVPEGTCHVDTQKVSVRIDCSDDAENVAAL